MDNQMYKIIMLGPPASGKGTQAEFLADKLNVPTISAGQLLREEVEKKSEIGKQVNEYMKSGALVPNHFTNDLIKIKLAQSATQQGFISDGFPRVRIQAKFLETITDITHVLLVDISDDEVVRRLAGRRSCAKCGKVFHLEFNPPKKQGVCDECGDKLEHREDDTPTAIHQRLKIYHQETEEVIEYYRAKNLLIEINGEQSIEEVRKEIFSHLF